MANVMTFGEIMLRLSPPMYNQIEQTHEFLAHYGGGEANVAVSLSHLGHNVSFVTQLPDNELGRGAIKYLRSHGVNVDSIIRGGDNIGIYFLENGFGGRPSKVLYNRKHSAFTQIDHREFDYDQIFQHVDWFHVSGITLALSPQVLEATIMLLKEAVKRNIRVSFDFNYRSKLWSKEEAKVAIIKVLPYVDVCFASLFDIEEILEYKSNNTHASVLNEFASIHNIKYIFGTNRQVISANENILSAYVYLHQDSYKTSEYRFNIIDRVGGGDAFASGVICGLLSDYEKFENAVELGLASSVLKHTIIGDSNTLKLNDLINFINSSGKQIIER